MKSKKSDNKALVVIALIIIAVLIGHTQFGLFSTVGLPSGSVVHFDFETLQDEVSGQSLVAEQSSYMPTLVDNGYNGRAYLFDGIDDMLSFPVDSRLNLETWTIEAWIYPMENKHQYIIAKTDNFLLQQYYYVNSTSGTISNYLQSLLNSPNSGTTQGQGVNWGNNLNSWALVTFTYGPNGMRMFVNGTWVASTSANNFTFSFNTGNTSRYLTFGNRQGWESFGNRAFHGMIDEVTIIDRQLSDAEVAQRYRDYTIINTVNASNMIENPNFDSGASGWYLWYNSNVTAAGSISTTEYDTAPASYKIDCTSRTADSSYGIEFYTSGYGITLEANKTYRLSFRAKATTPFTITSIRLMKQSSPWTNYATTQGAAITTDWTTVNLTFRANTAASDTRVSLAMGSSLPVGESLYVDTFKLEQVYEAPSVCGNNICEFGESVETCTPDCLTTPVSQSGLIRNPNFDFNTSSWGIYVNTNNVTAFGDRTLDDYDTLPASYGVTLSEVLSGQTSGAVQFSQFNIPLEEGKTYSVTFRARATTPYTIPTIRLMKTNSPWNNYAQDRSAAIATSWGQYKLLYKSTVTATDGRLNFYVGTLPAGNTIYFDTFNMVETTEAIPEKEYVGYQYANGVCTEITVLKLTTPYNATFFNTLEACQTLIGGTTTNFVGYQYTNNLCIQKAIAAPTSAPPYNSTFLEDISDCQNLIIPSYSGYEFKDNGCQYKIITTSTSPYNATFVKSLTTCQSMIIPTEVAITYNGYYLIDNTCESGSVSSTITPYNDTFLSTIDACHALINTNTTGGSNQAGTEECTVSSDCVGWKITNNDCSMFWKPENITITGTCNSDKKCDYPVDAAVQCTNTQLLLQENSLAIAVIVVGIIVFLAGKRYSKSKRSNRK